MVFTLLINMIRLKEKSILNVKGHDLLSYMQSIMPLEALNEHPMTTLLD